MITEEQQLGWRRQHERREAELQPRRLGIPASSMKPGTWTLVDWPYADGYPKCWRMKIYRGYIYLRDEKHFPFTVACGHNSERSHSGCHFGMDDIRTLDDAKLHLFRRDMGNEFR